MFNSKRNDLPLLGKTIRTMRVARHMKQSELAAKCYMEKTYISRIESGNINITVISLYHIAKALDVTVKEILLDFSLGVSIVPPAQNIIKQTVAAVEGEAE